MNLGLEVPYRYGSEARYLPDFIVLVDDGRRGDDDDHALVEQALV